MTDTERLLAAWKGGPSKTFDELISRADSYDKVFKELGGFEPTTRSILDEMVKCSEGRGFICTIRDEGHPTHVLLRIVHKDEDMREKLRRL